MGLKSAAMDAASRLRPVPRHVALIMDGNGRWASERGLPRVEGHRNGAKVVRTVTTTAADTKTYPIMIQSR